MIKPLKDDFLKMHAFEKKAYLANINVKKKHSIIFHIEWQLSVLENTCLVDLIADFSQPGSVALPLGI